MVNQPGDYSAIGVKGPEMLFAVGATEQVYTRQKTDKMSRAIFIRVHHDLSLGIDLALQQALELTRTVVRRSTVHGLPARFIFKS